MERKHIKLQVVDVGDDVCIFRITEQEGVERGQDTIGEWERVTFCSYKCPGWDEGGTLWLRGWDIELDYRSVVVSRDDMNRIEAAVRVFNREHSGEASSASDAWPHVYEVE